MAEPVSIQTLPAAKSGRYETLLAEINAVLDGEDNRVARMATVTAMLAAAFKSFFWTGFYVVDANRPNELVIGPYQGTLGCLRIAFGRGVCGAAAAARRTMIVADVHAFPGHIACDSQSRSEIVIPVFDAKGELIAVLDVDSTELATFNDEDKVGLEAIVRHTFGN